MYIYIYIYTHTHLVRHGNRQDVSLWFPSPTSSNDFYGFHRCFFNGSRRGRERFLMVSVVGFLMVSVVAGKHYFMVSVLAAASDKRGLRRAEGGMPPIRSKIATALGTRRRAVIVASSCAAQRPRILT